MATRSSVGAYTAPNQQGLQMAYCHWDGYPEGVGATIWRNLEKWGWDFRRMAEFLLKPKVGWSSLAYKDFDVKPSWFNHDGNGASWYDDRPGEMPKPGDEPERYTELATSSDSWLEWQYVIDPFTERVYVWSVCKQRGIWISKGETWGKIMDFFAEEEGV